MMEQTGTKECTDWRKIERWNEVEVSELGRQYDKPRSRARS